MPIMIIYFGRILKVMMILGDDRDDIFQLKHFQQPSILTILHSYFWKTHTNTFLERRSIGRRYELSRILPFDALHFLIIVSRANLCCEYYRVKELLYFSHLWQKLVLFAFQEWHTIQVDGEEEKEKEENIYIYIYFDTLRLCRIKSVGRYAHSESIHAVTWNPDMQDDYALLGNVLIIVYEIIRDIHIYIFI